MATLAPVAVTAKQKSPTTGSLLATGSTTTISAVNGTAASVGAAVTLTSGAILTLKADGTYTYDPNGKFNAATDAIPLTDSFGFTLSNGDTETVNISIGANKVATIAGTATAAVTESKGVDANGKLIVTGTLTVADADAGENKFSTTVVPALTGDLGNLTINATTGVFTYVVDNSLTQSLNAGQSKVDTFTVASLDGSAKQDITVTVNGTNTAFNGVAAGDMTTNSAMLWTRTYDPANASLTAGISENLTLQVSTDKAFGTLQSFGGNGGAGVTTAARDYTTKVDANGLQSGTQYYYRFKTAAGETSQIGSFKTAYDPNAQVAVRFGFSGDADGQWRPYSSTQNFDKLGLDFFAFDGDTIYETAAGKTPAGVTSAAAADPFVDPTQALIDYNRKYLENIQPTTTGGFSGLQKLFAAQGNYTNLDNHELGNNEYINGGAAPVVKVNGVDTAVTTATYKVLGSNSAYDVNTTGQFWNKTNGYKTLTQAYNNYEPVREKIISAPNDARTDGTQQLYYSQQWGKNATYINVDDRSYRDGRMFKQDATGAYIDDTGVRASNPDRTMLGKTQLAWLKQTLLDAQKNGTPWKFISISTPIDQIGAIGSGADGGKSWMGGYRAERNDLLKFIADNNINNVVFLACDDHQTRINELGYFTDINDQSTYKLLPNVLSIVDGPIGAGQSSTASGVVDEHSFAGIKALTDTLVNTQKAAGVNPVGLDANFMGLSNLKREGDATAGTAPQAVDFYSPDTFNYTTFDVSADGKSLNVNVQGINTYAKNTYPEPDPNNPVRSILSFTLNATLANTTPPPLAVTADKLIDLTKLTNAITTQSSVSGDAAYNNFGGFYVVDDATGKIGSLKPSDAGYAAAALNNAVLTVSKYDTTGNYQLAGGKMLASFLVANGTVADFLTKNASNSNPTSDPSGKTPLAYFSYAAANADTVKNTDGSIKTSIDHVQVVGNQYRWEDTFNGGDKDFNDFTIQLNNKPA